MRIIAGKAKGRRLKSIKGTAVRPTKDRVKEAVFNILAPVVPGCTCLDLFAGFGGLGLEALSRGAVHNTFVESNYKNADIIKENIQLCGFESLTNIKIEDVFVFLKNNSNKYDLIFMDPPYGKGYADRALQQIYNNKLLDEDGIVVVEHACQDTMKNYKDMKIIRQKTYGESGITIYQSGRNCDAE